MEQLQIIKRNPLNHEAYRTNFLPILAKEAAQDALMVIITNRKSFAAEFMDCLDSGLEKMEKLKISLLNQDALISLDLLSCDMDEIFKRLRELNVLITENRRSFFVDIEESFIRKLLLVVSELKKNDYSDVSSLELIHQLLYFKTGKPLIDAFNKSIATTGISDNSKTEVGLWFLYNYYDSETPSRGSSKTFEQLGSLRYRLLNLDKSATILNVPDIERVFQSGHFQKGIHLLDVSTYSTSEIEHIADVFKSIMSERSNQLSLVWDVYRYPLTLEPFVEILMNHPNQQLIVMEDLKLPL